MGHVAGMGEVKTLYQIFGILMQVRDLLGGPQHNWNDNIKMDIKWDMKIWAEFVWLRVIFICVGLCRRQ
jgi:hypothetical protein